MNYSRLCLLSLVCGFVFFACGQVLAQQQTPKVTVTCGDPGDPDINQTVTCDVSASVDNPPQAAAEHTLVAHWSWSIGDQEYSATGVDGTFGPVTDGSTFHVDGGTDDTQPNATFTGTFVSDGYYEVQVIATVNYVDPADSSKNQGPYSNTDDSGYVGDTNDDTSGVPPGASPNATPAQAQPMASSSSTTGKPKVKVAGIRILLNGTDVTGQTHPRLAGQQINLTAKVPASMSLTNAQWYFAPAGGPIADWAGKSGGSSGATLYHTPSQLVATSISFYWLAPGTSLEARYGGNNASGKYVTGSVFFNVTKPPCAVNPAYGAPSASYDGLYVLSFGDLSGSIKPPGVVFHPVFPKGLQGGSYNWCQTLTTYYVTVNGIPDPGNPKMPALDSQNPYGISNQDAEDTPHYDTHLLGNDEFKFKATMYLMWTPPGANSIAVPLASVVWGFDITASYIGWNPGGSADPPNTPNYNVINEPDWTRIFNP